MSQDLVTQEQSGAMSPALFHRGGALSPSANVGAIAIEQERAIAEAQGKMILAKRFPRSLANARAEFMDACADPEFAKSAFYSVKNRGTGPSIRFAEEVARCYGNMDYGHKELSRGDGKSEVEVYAWDMERNNYSRRQITVEHVLDTQDGPRKLRNQGDIDNRIANIASKQARGRILALMPKALVAAGIERCKLTIAGGGEKPMSDRINAMVEAFKKFGVTVAHLETHLEHKVDSTTLDELVDLTGIFNALKEGAKASDFFGNKEAEAEASAATANKLADAAKAGAAAAPKRTRREPAAQQQVDAQQQDNAQQSDKLTQDKSDSKPTENQSTSTEAQESNVTNSPEASSSDSNRANAEQEGPLF